MRKQRNRSGGKKINLKVLRVFLIVVLVVIGLAQIALANSLSAEGEQIRLLERERKKLLSRNAALREKTAALGSLGRIKDEAERRLGMTSGGEAMEFLVPPRLASR